MRKRWLGATCQRARLRSVSSFALLVAVTAPLPAFAAQAAELFDGLRNNRDTILFAVFVGLVLVATTVAILYLTSRRRQQQRENALTAALNETRGKLDRAEIFLAAEPHIVIVWDPQGGDPEIEGDISLVSDAPVARRILGFGSWLPPDRAQVLEKAVDRLRERGEPFRVGLLALNQRHFEVDGRVVTGRAVMRIREVSGERLETTRLHETLGGLTEELEIFRALVNSIPCPAWVRDRLGRLAWVNTAYVKAVEAKDTTDAMSHRIELLESLTREASSAKREHGETYRGQATVVLAGRRRSISVVEVPFGERAIGIVFDVSDLERAQFDLQQMVAAHSRTLDQLSTAVAIFDRGKRLVFHNSAYRQLWGLDQAFLEQNPSEPEILDRLRARQLLPEQADFRSWRDRHLAHYQALETAEEIWHLPNGRTLRAGINPNPQSGVTYVFDDLTKQRQLEAEFNKVISVQRETLDTLKEGVALFGTDGKLKLSNAAFSRLWRLGETELKDSPHIERVAALCSRLSPDPESWDALRMAVAGLHDHRIGSEHRLVCRDGTILDCTTAPLPDGATLLTFTDMTASVSEERLRNDFVHHVSYELRSPLTNIIGFIQLLGDGSTGSLNPKQSEYVGYVMKSSAALMAIINDILDLATIDTGELELNLKRVDALETIHLAAEGIQDRLAESTLNLQIVALPDVGSFVADPKRVRQVLFNLLSNAIGFSSPGQTVTLAALRRGDDIVFKVADQGRGIPEALVPHVFDRFHSNTLNSRHRGVGLGLSLVKSFVELHGGSVLIDSVVGQGTQVTCIFPARNEKVIDAHETSATRELGAFPEN